MYYSVNNGIPLVYHLYFEVYNTDNTSTSMYVYWDMMMYLLMYLFSAAVCKAACIVNDNV